MSQSSGAVCSPSSDELNGRKKKKQEKKCSSGPAPLQTRPTEDEDEQGHFEFLFLFFLNKKRKKKNSIGTPRGRASRLLEKVKTFNISEGQHERDEGLRGKRPVRNSPHQLSNFIFQSFDTLRVHLRMQITRWQCNIIS